MTPKYTWMNGHLVPWEESRLHISTEAVLRGASVFEGIAAYEASDGDLLLFRLADHLKRLYHTSMRFLRMQVPYDSDDLTRAICTLLEANEVRSDAHIRVVVYFGDLRPGRELEAETGAFIIVSGRHSFPTGKMRVTLSPWRRLSDVAMPPRVKATGNYLNSRIAATDAQKKGFESAILLNDRGRVSEGPWMNLFLVREGTLITPGVTAGILEGVTRSTVMELARHEAIPIEVRDVDPTELYIADELFFCGTAYEVTPIVSIDGFDVGHGEAGPVTSSIRDAYFQVVRGRTVAPDNWVTSVRGLVANQLAVADTSV